VFDRLFLLERLVSHEFASGTGHLCSIWRSKFPFPAIAEIGNHSLCIGSSLRFRLGLKGVTLLNGDLRSRTDWQGS